MRFALQALPSPLLVTGKNSTTGRSTVEHLTALGIGASESQITSADSDIARVFLIAGLLAVAVAIALSWWLGGRVSKPVLSLSDAATAVAERGDLSLRVPQRRGPRETVTLTRTFNQALAHVQEMYTALETVLIKQRQFIHDASHELRTPLTTMSATLETISLHPEMEPDSRAAVVSSALAEARRMANLIDGLLTLASFDSGENLRRVEFSWGSVLEECARGAVRNLTPRQVIVDIGQNLPSSYGDAKALQQMVECCIDNVRNYTPPDVTMTMQASVAADGTVVVSVADDGPGVPEQFLATLADRFVQVDPARSGEAPGLGLAIASAIAAGHGGSLQVGAVKPTGLRVVISIPPGKPAITPERRRAPRPA